MNLYEHQSTVNPNMPLRGFLYFGQLYHKYLQTRGINIYSSKLQNIPVPHYVVFYNGTKEEPDEQILLLSDAFQREHQGQYVHGCLECEARMLNINYGHTKAIDDCITEGVLKDFLIERKSEVLEMVLYSFDKELYEKDLKQIAFEEGEQLGEQNKLIALVQKKLQRGDSVEKIADDLMESNETITGIIDIINK